ncbi:adenylate/guanylate cyclase domain-containing protein [Myxococcus sp. AB025B]|uniref:adenylate/guanylate cyclase domain-containing protein n=1 Tax=Myxococcus sp. AB025B TaxID=2562794 RepID=UPI0011438DCC|nr:adenylate/guanylate cyclase domain-containing protein [Myxococcus sp. AB025B]
MTLTRKLILAFMALAGASVVAALQLTTLAVESSAQQKISTDLERTLDAFQQLARASQERIRDVAEAHTRDRSFKDMSLLVNSQDAAAGLGDEGTEGDGFRLAREVITSADTDVFGSVDDAPTPWAFFNASGRLVYTHAAPERYGDEAPSLPLLATALRGVPASALWSPARLRQLPFAFVAPEQLRETDLLLVHAQPAFASGRELVGVLLSGQWVGDVLLGDPLAPRAPSARMGDTRARFAVRAEDGAVVSQLPLGALLQQRAPRPGQAQDVDVGGVHYLMREATLSGVDGSTIGQVFVLRDFDAEINPILERFRRWLVPAALGIALFALTAAVFMARGLAAPLVELEAAAGRVRLGDLSVEVPVRGSDEAGRVAQAFNEMVGGMRQRDHIKGLFKRYLAPQVVDELLKHPEKAAPGGERKMLTVLFSDLVGFTSMSERLSPEELVTLLNTYFEQATDVLTRHGATLDKFIGDAIMCFWNAPLPQEDHAARACLTALELVAVVERLAPLFEARGLPRLDCRIGINTGQGVAGNLGSSAAQDYTVIGDTVNLASRLEGAAKVFGTRTLVAEDTVRSAGGVVLTRELDLLRVKGKQQPVRVFELVGPATMTPPPHLSRYAEGLALYRARRFAEARDVLEASLLDAPSARLADRCAALLEAPPADDWDAVLTLDSK